MSCRAYSDTSTRWCGDSMISNPCMHIGLLGWQDILQSYRERKQTDIRLSMERLMKPRIMIMSASDCSNQAHYRRAVLDRQAI